MKKIKIFLLSLFFVALGTVGAVAGFYVKENPKAVVNWLNNTINVTNDDYKQLVEESKLTALQLNLEIASLEEENSQLQIEKEDLTNRVAELEQSEEDNQELIQEYTTRIEELDAQIVEKDLMIVELQELISSIYEGLINEIFVLPDDLQGVSLSIYPNENDFLLVGSGLKQLYYFNYDSGILHLVSSNIAYYYFARDYKFIPDGFLFAGINAANTSTRDLIFYNTNTNESTVLLEGIVEYHKLYDYNKGCLIFSSKGLHYFDYTTNSCVQYSDVTLTSTTVQHQEYEDYDVFWAYCTNYLNSSDSVIFMKKADNTVYKLNHNPTKGFVYSKVFELHDKFYFILGSSTSSETLGLYKINVTDFTTEIVYTFDVQTGGGIGNLFVNEDVAVFGHQKYIYSFNGENVSIILDAASNVASTSSYNSTLIGKTETARYYSSYNSRYILKSVKGTSEVSTILLDGNFFVGTQVNDIVSVMGTASGVYTLDMSSDTLTRLHSTTYVREKIWVIGDKFYLYHNESSNSRLVRVYDCETLASLNSVSCKSPTDYLVFGETVIFYSSTDYSIVNPDLTTYGVNISVSYNSALSNFVERTFYKQVVVLDNGILYEKVVYNEDFTDYTRSLVLVK